jgi:aldehyde:ferredoxin oxidoreductase
MVEGGFSRRLLYVDLGSEEMTVKTLPDADVLREVVGGIGLGLRLLLDDVQPPVQASDPGAPLISRAGPGPRHSHHRARSRYTEFAEGKSIAPHLEQMVDDYYSLMGWDEKGRPTPDTLKRMGLEGALQ